MEDSRSKKIALVAHCILNQNAKVGGLARYPAAVRDVVDLLLDHDYGIIQMPCPEMCSAGLRRWWHVREQYSAPPFRRVFQRLAGSVIDQVEEYLREGYLCVLVGIDGSPSCGVTVTGSDPRWGGCPNVRWENQEERLVPGQGVFVEALNNEAGARGLARIPQLGVPLDVRAVRQVRCDAIRKFLERAGELPQCGR